MALRRKKRMALRGKKLAEVNIMLYQFMSITIPVNVTN